MKLSVEEIGLLRSLVEWRRKTGWRLTVNRYDRDDKTGRAGAHLHEYDHPSGPRVEVDRFRYDDGSIQVEVTADNGSHRLFQGWPTSVRSAVNGIAAAEVIPPEKAPMFRAGVESLPWSYAVQLRHGDVKDFGEDLAGAVAYAAPSPGYPQLTVLRWRQGPMETAVIPDAV